MICTLVRTEIRLQVILSHKKFLIVVSGASGWSLLPFAYMQH